MNYLFSSEAFLMATVEPKQAEDFVQRIPRPDVIKERLSENLEEAKLLRQMLRVAVKRDRAREAAAT